MKNFLVKAFAFLLFSAFIILGLYMVFNPNGMCADEEGNAASFIEVLFFKGAILGFMVLLPSLMMGMVFFPKTTKKILNSEKFQRKAKKHILYADRLHTKANEGNMPDITIGCVNLPMAKAAIEMVTERITNPEIDAELETKAAESSMELSKEALNTLNETGTLTADEMTALTLVQDKVENAENSIVTSVCSECGSTQENGKFCTNCGKRL